MYATKEVSKSSQRIPNGHSRNWTARHWGVWGAPHLKEVLLNWGHATSWLEGGEAESLKHEIRWYWLYEACVASRPEALLRVLLGWSLPGHAVKPPYWEKALEEGRKFDRALRQRGLRDCLDRQQFEAVATGLLQAWWRPAAVFYHPTADQKVKEMAQGESILLRIDQRFDEETREIWYTLGGRYAVVLGTVHFHRWTDTFPLNVFWEDRLGLWL